MLLRVAVSILGDVKDAEDMVQDTFVKWFERDTSHVVQVKEYLVTMLRNACMNFLRGLKKQFPNTLSIDAIEERSTALAESWNDFDLENELASSYATLSRKLNSTEKSVYMMREVFDLKYQEIASIMDKKVENCRKILDRAKQRLSDQNDRFRIEAEKQAASFESFREACNTGKVQEYLASIKDEVLEKVR